jgi:hypothetical protein
MRDARPGTVGKKRLTPVEALNEMRRGQLRYNKTRAKHSAPAGLLLALQKGLETAGLGGAAHPVREFPKGGQMMIPWGGPSGKALLKALGELPVPETITEARALRAQHRGGELGLGKDWTAAKRAQAVKEVGEDTVQEWEKIWRREGRHPYRTARKNIREWERLEEPNFVVRQLGKYPKRVTAAGAAYLGMEAWDPSWWHRAGKYHGYPFASPDDRYDPKSQRWYYQSPEEAQEWRGKVAHQELREGLYRDLAKLEKAGADIDVPEAIRRLKLAKYEDVFEAYVDLKNTHKPPPGGWSWK